MSGIHPTIAPRQQRKKRRAKTAKVPSTPRRAERRKCQDEAIQRTGLHHFSALASLASWRFVFLHFAARPPHGEGLRITDRPRLPSRSKPQLLPLLLPLRSLPFVFRLDRLTSPDRFDLQSRQVDRAEVVVEKCLGRDRDDRLDEGEHGVGVIADFLLRVRV